MNNNVRRYIVFDKERRNVKMIGFYQSLPDELLENIIGTLHINRDLRRKTMDDKVKMFLSSKSRFIFADAAYNAVKDKVDLELDKATYNDIIDSITDDNKLYTAIFFFRWCYEDGTDGISNDAKYFDTFVDSDIFDRICKGISINDSYQINKNISLSENSDYEVTEQYDSGAITDSAVIDEAKEKQDEVNTMKLLGRIERRNTYYNFFPQYELVGNRFVEIPFDKIKSDYPTSGGINLACL